MTRIKKKARFVKISRILDCHIPTTLYITKGETFCKDTVYMCERCLMFITTNKECEKRTLSKKKCERCSVYYYE